MNRTVDDILGVETVDLPVDGKTLAGVLGLTVRRVDQMATAGTIPRAAGGLFDLPTAVQAYIAFRTRRLDAAKERKTLAEAELAEMRAAALRQELLDAKEVEREWSNIIRDIRASVMALPGRLAGRLSHLSPADVSEIDSELREALTTLGGSGDE